MTQATPTISADQSGLAYRTADNNGKKALLNHHKGATAPTYAEAGILWLDDSATPWLLKIYDGTDWVVIGAVNSTSNTIEIYHGTAGLRILNHATDTGAANAYAIAPTPPITAYMAGQIITLKPANGQTAACTIAVNGLTAKNIKTLSGPDPASGTLSTTGIYALMYDGTNFVILNPNVTAALLGAAVLGSAQTFSGAQKVSATVLTSSAAHIATDLSLNNIFTHTLTENTTLDNPTNIVAGWQGSFQFTNHASAPKTLAYGSYFKFPGGTVPTLTATNGAADTLFCSARSTTFIEANLVKGFA